MGDSFEAGRGGEESKFFIYLLSQWQQIVSQRLAQLKKWHPPYRSVSLGERRPICQTEDLTYGKSFAVLVKFWRLKC
jgi:hypothetical protein